MLNARYIMVGGFLGAGKTTALLRLAQRLSAQGLRVGLITNDQSVGLVDTAVLDAGGFPTEEITGGCFCCRFNSLLEAADKLAAGVQPDVFLAEPVGSCTDLRATVSYPLQQMYGDRYRVAPLSVLVDPLRLETVLGLNPAQRFSPKVVYIYEKQIEEADLLVLNKTDLVDDARLDALESAVLARWPHLRVLRASARTGAGLEAWLELLLSSEMKGGDSMAIDYDDYAEGEALLGWLNAAVEVRGIELDGNAWALAVARGVQEELQRRGAEIAHLKLTLTPRVGSDLAVANLVRSGGSIEFSHTLADPLDEGELLLNVRAEIAPEQLQEAALESLRRAGGSAKVESRVLRVEAFRPGRPEPTYRLASG